MVLVGWKSGLIGVVTAPAKPPGRCLNASDASLVRRHSAGLLRTVSIGGRPGRNTDRVGKHPQPVQRANGALVAWSCLFGQASLLLFPTLYLLLCGRRGGRFRAACWALHNDEVIVAEFAHPECVEDLCE